VLAALCCGKNTCNHPPTTPNVPHCVYCNRDPLPLETDQNATHSSHAVEKAGFVPSCEPGTYQCTRRYADSIEVCGQDKKWRLAATCCGIQPCEVPSTLEVPQCNCSPSPRSLDASAPKAEIRLDDTQYMASDYASTQCTPGTYQCRQPFLTGHLQVCNAQGVWQISSECCGPYTCYDAPGDEPAHCMCTPEARTLDAIRSPSSDKAVDVPQSDDGIQRYEPCWPGAYKCDEPGTAPLMVCNALRRWIISSKCCGLHTCQDGHQSGTAYCLC
jgi:hypothetical protein